MNPTPIQPGRRITSRVAVRVLTAGGVLTIALLVFESLLVVRMYNALHDLTVSEVHLQELRGEVQYLDEVLAASVGMAAATRDLEPKDRYDDAEPMLQSRLREMLALTADPVEQAAGRRLESTRSTLVNIEREAFRLIEEGRATAALDLLQGGRYIRQRELFAQSLQEGATAISDRLAGLRTAYWRRVVAVLILTGLSLAFLLTAWAGAIFLVRRHYRVLGDAADAAAMQAMVFDSVRDSIVLFDERGMIVSANPAMGRLLGVDPRTLADKPIDRVMLDAGHIPEPAADPQRLEVRTGTDASIPVEASVALARFDTGRVVRAAVLRDLRERIQLEAELRQAQKMEALGTLAGGIAHDFSNLLAAITGFAENARASLPEGHRARTALERLDGTVDHAAGMTRSLLTFCRKAPAERTAVDMKDVVTDTARLLGPLLPKRIAFEHDLPASAAWVQGDPAQLRQVAFNLCLNARDAMPDGGRLSMSLTADEGTVRLEIRDDGAGMDEQTQRRIFEPFYTTKAGADGTGLGLAIVHGIVAEHAGDITVESAPGEGAAFTVTLPSIDPPEPTPDIESLSIVIAITDPYERSILASAFRREGHTILSADAARADILISDGVEPPTGLSAAATVVIGADETRKQTAARVVTRPFGVQDVLDAIRHVRADASVSPNNAPPSTSEET